MPLAVPKNSFDDGMSASMKREPRQHLSSYLESAAAKRVVLKVLSKPGDEWCSGDVSAGFSVATAWCGLLKSPKVLSLLERILPGNSLLDLVLAGRDEERRSYSTDVLLRMSPAEAPETSATVEDWAAGFDRYFNGTNRAIPIDLAQHGRETWLELCASPRPRRLLHGDLHTEHPL
jgi:streptomycin 6-kinase